MRALAFALVVALGCGPAPEAGQVLTLNVLGLHETENPYALESGALVRANDAAIERAGVIQSARGWQDTGMTALVGTTANAGTFFQDVLVFQAGTSGMSYLSGSTRTSIPGTFTPPTGRKMRFVKANKSLYFTTSTGVKKLEAYDSTPIAAGGLRPLHLTATPTGTSGFLAALRSTAFRVVWSRKDENGYVIQGPPSQFEIVTNSAVATSVAGQVSRVGTTVTVNTAAAHGLTTGETVYMDSTDVAFPAGDYTVTVTDADTFTFTQSGDATSSTEEIAFAYSGRDVALVVYIPSEITSTDQGWYAEVFRTYDQTPDAESSPADDMGKVYEYRPTNVDITNGYFSFTDSTPDALVQVPLYTNATEEGLAQANDPPPVCSDLAYWNGHMLCSETRTAYGILVSMLATPEVGSWFRLMREPVGPVSEAYLANTAESGNDFQVFTSGSPAENIANTARSLVRVVNSNSDYWTATYVSGPNDPPGMIYFCDRTPTTERSWIRPLNDKGTKWAPAPVSEHAFDGSRTANVVTATTVNHGLVVGQEIYVEPTTGDDPLTVTVASTPDADTFTFASIGADNPNFDGFFFSRDVSDALPSVNDTTFEVTDASNRLYYSKYGQPEAVPALNYIDVGAPDDTIRRIVPLRDSVFIFMEKSGVWRLSGQEPFYLDQFDETVRLLGDENLTVLDNKIVALTAKGVVTISESGVSRPVSYPLEKSLLDLTATALSAVKTYGFAIGHESARKFQLYLPSSSSDTKATQSYILHLDTGTWVRATDDAYFGAWDTTNDVLYLSRGTTIEKERKARASTDYTGRTFDVKWAPITAGDPTVLKHWPEVSVVLTGNTATTLTAYFSTDLSTSEESVSVTGVPANGSVRIMVPIEKQRGGELNVRLTHSTAGECLSVAGLKVKLTQQGGPVNR